MVEPDLRHPLSRERPLHHQVAGDDEAVDLEDSAQQAGGEDVLRCAQSGGAAAVQRGDLLEGSVQGVGTVRTRIA